MGDQKEYTTSERMVGSLWSRILVRGDGADAAKNRGRSRSQVCSDGPRLEGIQYHNTLVEDY